MRDAKKEYRKSKREIKKAGNRNRRNYYKRQLQENPEEAHWDFFEFKYDSTETMNGQYLDNKRYESREFNK